MTATYDDSLATNKDYVRFLAGDRGTATGVGDNITGNHVSDEEIAALLTEELDSKYLAAARVCGLIISKGQGAVSKTVGNLAISFGDSPESAYRAHMQELRERGAELLLSRNDRVWTNL